jgi:hypothetical protein
MVELYPFLREAHFYLSRIGLAVAVSMCLLGFIIGVLRKGDVTRGFRYGVYTVAATMALQALIGALLYFGVGTRPAEEVHLIYGVGAALALPFFIFVEVTAKKRPAMGSYIWGFAVLAGILIRGIMTGRAG